MFGDIVQQLDHIFKPRAVAIVGASNYPGWGHDAIEWLLEAGFSGDVYPVNHSQSEIMGLPAYPRVLSIPGVVDLAVIAVPAAAVPQVLEECIQKGVRGAVIISAGFAEIGESGKHLQDRIAEIARKGDIRFVGPNCNGIISTGAKVCFSTETAPSPGPIAVVSQSGTLGSQLVRIADSRRYGISKFISVGNQADLNVADYLAYLSEDQDTRVIALYVEGIVEGRRFLDVAKEVVKRKPVVVYKGGSTVFGGRATLSHTASLAGRDEVFDAMCRQVGFIRTREVMHLCEMAHALASQTPASGRRVAIVGTGGQCVATTDACGSLGLKIPEFDKETVARLSSMVPPYAPTPRNPVDFAGGRRSAMDEANLVEMLAGIEYIDAIIANTPLTFMKSESSSEVADAAVKAAEIVSSLPKKYGKPVVLLELNFDRHGAMADILRRREIPVYQTPEQCARAVYALAAYGEIRRRFNSAAK